MVANRAFAGSFTLVTYSDTLTWQSIAHASNVAHARMPDPRSHRKSTRARPPLTRPGTRAPSSAAAPSALVEGAGLWFAHVTGRLLLAGLAAQGVVAVVAAAVGESRPSVLASSALRHGAGDLSAATSGSRPRWTPRRLLWRVRRKLILSYIFIGFVPALLIVAFFLLGGLLLFSNFSSYLVQTRLRALTDAGALPRADGAARDAARDGGRGRARHPRTPAGARPRRAIPSCRSPWCRRRGVACPPALPAPDVRPHGRPMRRRPRPPAHGRTCGRPSSLPAGWTASGFAGLCRLRRQRDDGQSPAATGRDVRMLVRAVASAGDAGRRRTRWSSTCRSTIRIEAAAARRDRRRARSTSTSLEPTTAARSPTPRHARRRASAPRRPATAFDLTCLRRSSCSTATGDGRSGALPATMQLSIAEHLRPHLRRRLRPARTSASGLLLVVLVVVGVLFLVIQVVALVTGLALARSITGSVHELFTGTERVRRATSPTRSPSPRTISSASWPSRSTR